MKINQSQIKKIFIKYFFKCVTRNYCAKSFESHIRICKYMYIGELSILRSLKRTSSYAARQCCCYSYYN